MAIPLPKYAQIKDKYCVGYFGTNANVVLQLKRARPFVEKALPGLKLYIACPDHFMNLMEGESQVVPGSELEGLVSNYQFAYYRELDHTDPDVVKGLLLESSIPFPEEILKTERSCIDIARQGKNA